MPRSPRGTPRHYNSRALLASEDGADVVELVEGGHGGEVVDVDAQQFVAHLGQDGVIKLEK